jgi:hypothetical protein
MPSSTRHRPGFALTVVLVITLVLALLVTLLITIVISEYKIAKSQEAGTGAFYIAEAGAEEALWLVQNNQTYKNHLEDGTFDQTNGDFSHNPALLPNSRYEVSIRSTNRGAASITTTGYYTLGPQTSKRTIKTKIFKSLNPNPIGEHDIFTADDIDVLMSIINIHGGGIFSNRDIDIPGPASLVTVEKDASAVNRISLAHEDVLQAANKYATNYPPAPDPIDFPMVDFDDYRSKATIIYTKEEFEDLMWANQDLTLNNDITYITMAPTDFLRIRGDQHLTINGVLVIDGSIKIGQWLCWKGGPGPQRCGLSDITVNHTVGKASGIIVKGDIDFNLFTGNINIQGLLYGNDQLSITSLPQEFNITGGLIGRRFFCTSLWQGINITYDEDIIRTGLGTPIFSPVIQIEHWEEQY